MLAGQRLDDWSAYIKALRAYLKQVKEGVTGYGEPAKPGSRPPQNKGAVARSLRQQIARAVEKQASGGGGGGGTAPVSDTGLKPKQIEELWKAYKRSLSYLIQNLKRGSVPSASPLPTTPSIGQPSRALARDIQTLMERDYPNAVNVARNIEAKRDAQQTLTPAPGGGTTGDPQNPEDPYRYVTIPPNDGFQMPEGEFQPPPGNFKMPPAGDTVLTTPTDGAPAGEPMSGKTKVVLAVVAGAAIWYFFMRKKRR